MCKGKGATTDNSMETEVYIPADFYEEEVEQLVSGISRLVEPLLLVVLGGMVGGMMIAMYLPIFKLAGGA